MHVWLASLRGIAEQIGDPEGVLAQPERSRAASFAFGEDRAAYAAARAFLRCVLAASGSGAEQDPFAFVEQASAVELSAGPYGKPVLRAGGLAFNATRTRTHVAVVTTDAGDVGIDMEPVARTADMTEQMLQQMFAPRELAAWADHPDRALRALSAWTRKEAVAKADGRGLSLPFARMVTWETGERPDALPQSLGSCSDWRLHTETQEGTVISTALRLQPASDERRGPAIATKIFRLTDTSHAFRTGAW